MALAVPVFCVLMCAADGIVLQAVCVPLQLLRWYHCSALLLNAARPRHVGAACARELRAPRVLIVVWLHACGGVKVKHRQSRHVMAKSVRVKQGIRPPFPHSTTYAIPIRPLCHHQLSGQRAVYRGFRMKAALHLKKAFTKRRVAMAHTRRRRRPDCAALRRTYIAQPSYA